MVAVGPSPFSARLVRWTRRMAYALNAPWIALSVDTGVPCLLNSSSGWTPIWNWRGGWARKWS